MSAIRMVLRSSNGKATAMPTLAEKLFSYNKTTPSALRGTGLVQQTSQIVVRLAHTI